MRRFLCSDWPARAAQPRVQTKYSSLQCNQAVVSVSGPRRPSRVQIKFSIAQRNEQRQGDLLGILYITLDKNYVMACLLE